MSRRAGEPQESAPGQAGQRDQEIDVLKKIRPTRGFPSKDLVKGNQRDVMATSPSLIARLLHGVAGWEAGKTSCSHNNRTIGKQ